MARIATSILAGGRGWRIWVPWVWLVAVNCGLGASPPAHWDARWPQGFTPGWFGPVIYQPALNLHIWRAPVRVPAGDEDLAATFVFRQVPGGVARVIWQGPGRVVTICANLFEQAAPLHQRTLLIARETLGVEGQLFVESNGACLERVELHWVRPEVLSPAGEPARLISPGGRIWPQAELGGQPSVAAADEIHSGFVDALLEPGPISLEPGQGVRLHASLQGRPGHGRIRAQISGLRPDEEAQIWVNGSPLGAVAVEAPRLDDPGYRPAGRDGWEYGGWRTLTAFVPVGWLSAGENQVEWSAPAGGAGVVLRNMRLEVAAETGGWTPPGAAGRPMAASVGTAGRAASPAARQSAAFPQPQLRPGLSSARPVVGLRPE